MHVKLNQSESILFFHHFAGVNKQSLAPSYDHLQLLPLAMRSQPVEVLQTMFNKRSFDPQGCMLSMSF